LREQEAIDVALHPAPPEPSVQLPTVAIPLALVVAVPPVTLPPPPVTVKVTVTPLIGLFNASFTITLGAVATAAPLFAVCASPALIAIDETGPGATVIAEVPVFVPEVAVIVADPSATAVTTPVDASTVAAEVLSEAQVTV
jgi:hypothetical protein